MADVAIIVPTRGRPRRFAELLEAIDRTAELDVRVLAAVDDDDPARRDGGYLDLLVGRTFRCDPTVFGGKRKSLSGWTNHLAMQALESPDPPRYLVSLGDDHRPRTPGWDRRLAEAIEGLGGSGIAYGNDLLQGARLPTAWMVSADIVRVLGWMMLPALEHMYVDNATLDLGRALSRITYRPDVVIEHMHPVAGKAAADDSYRESNSAQRYAADGEAYAQWKADGFDADVIRVREWVAPAGIGGAR